MPTTETERARKREHDEKRLAHWRRDDEVRPQIEASIAARDARWLREDEEAKVEAKIRTELEAEDAEKRVRAKVAREYGLAGAEFVPQRAD